MNPEAHEADLGEKMEAYYDNERKVWVFPGENPEEVAKPIGPPPITPMMSQSNPAMSASSPTMPAPAPSNDPLAAMMAPPPRNPGNLAARSRTTPGGTPGKIPGMMLLPGSPQTLASPTFAVFQPASASKE